MPDDRPEGSARSLLLVRSNRIERLADGLAELLRATPPVAAGGLPATELVAVPTVGMGRWLRMALAQRLGICANIRFVELDAVFEGIPGVAGRAGEVWGRDRLVWALVEVLPGLLGQPAFAPLAGYLAEGAGPMAVSRRRMQLIRRLADTFDRYLVFRPGLVRRWDRGADADDWQAMLWRALRPVLRGPHLPEAVERLLAGGAPPPAPASRVILFGFAALPPLQLELLQAMTEACPVHLFVLCPSRAWWAQIRSRREIAWELRSAGGELSADELKLETGHPLLASLGRLGRDFQLLLEVGPDAPALPRRDAAGAVGHRYLEPYGELFEAPTGDTALAQVQRDILDLEQRGPGRETEPAALSPRTDRSIRIHSCHGPTRQVEVLRDELLALFDADPSLEPRDVLIIAPELDSFAPLIEAVFAAPLERGEAEGSAPRSLPVRIGDRSMRLANPAADALLAVLDLAGGRVSAPEVLDLLGLTPIRQRFGIDLAQLAVLRSWLRESGIRWGIDAAHRERVDQPRYEENTWRFGLDRLLLGWALPPEPGQMFEGVLPAVDIDGADADLLGALVDFTDRLFELLQAIELPRPMRRWEGQLLELIEQLLDDRGDAGFHNQALRQLLAELARGARLVGSEAELSLQALRQLIAEQLEQAQPASGFMGGQITVSGAIPGRAMPFSVVALLGMDDGAFPRPAERLSFDRMASHPAAGDRNQRDEDRYLFLSAVVAARRHLLICYSGRSIRDNKPLAPAVPVGELIDCVRMSLRHPDDAEHSHRRLMQWLIQEHPLHPFSPLNYGLSRAGRGRKPLSYDRRHLAAARQLLSQRLPAPGFLRDRLPAPEEPELPLGQLLSWYAHPARALLSRLSLSLEPDGLLLPEREPMELDGSERGRLGARLLRWRLTRGRRLPPYEQVRAVGLLPLGTPGRCLYRELVERIEPVALRVERERGAARPPLAVSLTLSSTRLVGQLVPVWDNGLVDHQYGLIRPRQLLSLWIRHLVWCALQPEPGEAPESRLVARRRGGDGVALYRLRPVRAARELLDDLVTVQREGLQLSLPLFPGIAGTYADIVRPRPHASYLQQRARKAARRVWQGAWGGPPGEGSDPYVERLIGDEEPFSPDFLPRGLELSKGFRFHPLVMRVWSPLLDHLEIPGSAARVFA